MSQTVKFLGEERVLPGLLERMEIDPEYVRIVHPEDGPPFDLVMLCAFIHEFKANPEWEPTENDRLWAWALFHQNLAELPYQEYLKSMWWQGIRYHVRNWDEEQCQTCLSTKNLHVHHKTYAHRGWEYPEDLILLCSTCHARVHGKDDPS